MSLKEAGLLNLVNSSGFLFQLRVEQEIRDTQPKHGKSVLAREHRWVHPRSGEEGFIDLITTAGTNGKIIIECKRVRQAEWIFLVPHGAKETRSTRVLWSKRFTESRQGAAWDQFAFQRDSLEAEFCIIRGHADSQQPMLERLSTTLLASVEALAQEELSYKRHVGLTGLRFYFPVIVTAATLYVCRVQPSEIELANGELKTASFEEVPYIRFTKSMSTSLPSSRPASTLEEAAREGRRTVFVVNASQLVPFLSGKWEFSPPEMGGPWPWDFTVWNEGE
jgi:hypothetical protein